MSYKYTKLSDFIAELQSIHAQFGDIPVCIGTEYGFSAYTYPEVQPYFYDGGYKIQDGIGSNGKPNFISSRKIDLKDPANKDLNSCIKLKGYYMEDDDNFENRPLRQVIPEEFIWLDEIEQKDRLLFGGELPQYRSTTQLDPQGRGYLTEAFLSSGMSYRGINMNEAKKGLAEKFKVQDPNKLMKEEL